MLKELSSTREFIKKIIDNKNDLSLTPTCDVILSLVDSHCDEFKNEVQCESKYQVGHEFDTFGDQACQQLCRDAALLLGHSLLMSASSKVIALLVSEGDLGLASKQDLVHPSTHLCIV